MKEDWISSSMTTGSMRSCTAIYRIPKLVVPLGIDKGFLGVLLDEVASSLHVLPHEGREHEVGGGGVLQGHLLQHAGLGVHGGLPQLLGVHLAEPLEPGHLHLLVAV